MFDITAPLERQRVGEREVWHIYDCGLDVEYPLAVWAEGILTYATRSGKVGGTGYNLHTIPEPKPDIVIYTNWYASEYTVAYRTLIRAAEQRGTAVATIKTTYNPNTGEATSVTVWRKK